MLFHHNDLLALAINALDVSSIGIFSGRWNIFNFGTYSFTGASSGLTDVELTIIYSKQR